MLDQITPIVITYNESDNIERTLGRLRWARHVIVLDSFSDDGTLGLARSFNNVEVVQHRFISFSDQWNYAFSYPGVKTDWILRMDADYVLSEALIDEIAALVPSVEVNAYQCSFQYCVGGHPLRGGLYPADRVLLRKQGVRFEQDGHRQLCRIAGGATEVLISPILHDDRKPLSRWLSAQARYAEEEAVKLRNTSWMDLAWQDRIRKVPFLAAPLSASYCLLMKGCILDGRPGMQYACERMVAELVISLKLLDR